MELVLDSDLIFQIYPRGTNLLESVHYKETVIFFQEQHDFRRSETVKTTVSHLFEENERFRKFNYFNFFALSRDTF